MNKILRGAQNTEAISPLISVVLPVYNGEKYLSEAVDSILAQTFSDFELIMIDDGSTDGSQQVMREYERRDLRVKAIIRENKGLANTLNESISIARGAWIARMDQDDIALPNRFERQLKWLEQTGADISGSWVQRFGSSDKRVVRLRQTDEAIKMEILFSSPFVHPSVMMKRELIKQLGYDSAWEKAEDYDLWERAAEAGWRMTNVPEVLLLYRVHAMQISTRTASLQIQQGEAIRRRYWMFLSHFTHLNPEQIDETLKIFESSSSSAVDMDVVDGALLKLLQHSQGESRVVILEHAKRIYFKMASSCPDIISRWDKFSRESGNRSRWGEKSKLFVLRLLRIRTDGVLFRRLRRLYLWGVSR